MEQVTVVLTLKEREKKRQLKKIPEIRKTRNKQTFETLEARLKTTQQLTAATNSKMG